MEIFRIFDDDNFLLAVVYDDEETDEFSRIFDEWTDIGWLENFFTGNESDLIQPFWQPVTIEGAVLKTRKEAVKLRHFFYSLRLQTPQERMEILGQFFKPLQKIPVNEIGLYKKKAYGPEKNSWLRIYALKVGDDMYLVTGGTIKLTATMEEREHTRKELSKAEWCARYLKEQGIIDEEGIIELIEF